mgnify:CR=1 FL=1
MAIQQTIMKAGTLREPHWYKASDTLLFVRKGEAFFTMMDDVGIVYNALLKPGDLVFIPVGIFHAYVNTGSDNLEIYEAFNQAKDLAELGILSGFQTFRPGTMASATGLSKETIEKIQKDQNRLYIYPF